MWKPRSNFFSSQDWTESARNAVRAHPLAVVGVALVAGLLLGRLWSVATSVLSYMRTRTQPASGGATLLSLALWLTGCATVVDTRVEQMIAAELPRVIGAAARYDVNVAGARETGDILDLRRVRIVGSRVERAGSPVLERIDVTMTDLVVDRKEKRLQSLGTADASALCCLQTLLRFWIRGPVWTTFRSHYFRQPKSRSKHSLHLAGLPFPGPPAQESEDDCLQAMAASSWKSLICG